jgi:hypothetical protein
MFFSKRTAEFHDTNTTGKKTKSEKELEKWDQQLECAQREFHAKNELSTIDHAKRQDLLNDINS